MHTVSYKSCLFEFDNAFSQVSCLTDKDMMRCVWPRLCVHRAEGTHCQFKMSKHLLHFYLLCCRFPLGAFDEQWLGHIGLWTRFASRKRNKKYESNVCICLNCNEFFSGICIVYFLL